MAERLPVILRGATAEDAIAAAKAWARAEGLTLRTLASCQVREDIPSWSAEGRELKAYEVVLVVKDPAGPLPEPPTLWAGVAL